MARGGYERREGAANARVSLARTPISQYMPSCAVASRNPEQTEEDRSCVRPAGVSPERESASAEVAGRGSGAEPAIESVDQLRHPVEPLGDAASSDLLEVVGLGAEHLRERRDHVIGRDRPVSMTRWFR